MKGETEMTDHWEKHNAAMKPEEELEEELDEEGLTVGEAEKEHFGED